MTNSAKILVVEDNPQDLILAGRLLRQHAGSRVSLLQAVSLAEAASTLRVTEVDVIVLDLNLPDSEGVATVTFARRLAGRQVPLVVLTGTDDPDLGLDCIDAGAEDYLPKPRMTEDLARAVDFALRRRRHSKRRALSLMRSLVGALPVGSTSVRQPELAIANLFSELLSAANDPAERDGTSRRVRTLTDRLVETGAAPADLFKIALAATTHGNDDDEWPGGALLSAAAIYLAQAYFERLQERGAERNDGNE